MLFSVFKATTQSKGSIYATNQLQDLFSEEYTKTIQHLNANLEAPVFPKTTWANYLRFEFQEFNNKYDAILNRYSANMQPEFVEVIESLKNSVFHQHMISSLSMIESWNRNNEHPTPDNMFGQLFTDDYTVQPYLDNIKSLLNLASKTGSMQDFFKIDEGSWRNDISPAIGSARV